MARIAFGFEELLEILVCNGLLPGSIARVRVKSERIHFVIRTNSFILPFVPASVKYLRLEGSHAVFELAIVSNRINKAASWLNQMLEPKMPTCVKLEYPILSVDIDKLLAEKNIRGVRVKEILFDNGEFTLITENA
jgi:hypothetical protein